MSVNLTTRYLGLSLATPLVVSSCPLSGNLTMLPRLEAARAGAIVLPSLFEEQIELQDYELYGLYDRHATAGGEPASAIPELIDYNAGPDSYLRLIEHAKRAVQVPIIASLNGTLSGNWVRYARLMQDAGADALELHICCIPSDPDLTAQQVEDRCLELVASVRQQVVVPFAVKIGPFYTALSNFARRLVSAGADGLVLFSRFLDPEIDIETLRVEPRLVLSHHHELKLPLRWLAILRDQLHVSLAATSGIHSAGDVIKAILAGADTVQMASALLRHGPDHLQTIHDHLVEWLEDHEYGSLAELRGNLSLGHCPDPSAMQRSSYLKIITSDPERMLWEDS